MSQGPCHCSAPALPGKNSLTLGGLKGACAGQNDGSPNMSMSESLKFENMFPYIAKRGFTDVILK